MSHLPTLDPDQLKTWLAAVAYLLAVIERVKRLFMAAPRHRR